MSNQQLNKFTHYIFIILFDQTFNKKKLIIN